QAQGGEHDEEDSYDLEYDSSADEEEDDDEESDSTILSNFLLSYANSQVYQSLLSLELEPVSETYLALLGLTDENMPSTKSALQYNKQRFDAVSKHRNMKLSVSVKGVTCRDSGTSLHIIRDPELLIKVSHQEYGMVEAVGLGTSRAFSVITDNIRGFKKIASGDVSASKALSGPIGIAQMFGGVWDWTRFWMLTGLLSMALAFMNILPIPALDGGHAVFLVYEMITGKPASDKVLERAQQVGMIILLALMAYTFGNDIFKALF
ncbi:MAG: RIP metalloprotease, partial [Alphaproteobacteria bacterium]|nr:RIP metalloprotease [Alphaproteobacteria bacterium]